MVAYALHLRIMILVAILVSSAGTPAWATHTSDARDMAHLAVFKYPVTDLFITYSPGPIEKQPASPQGPSGQGACKRAHQGLAHELVTCVNYRENLVEVAFDNLFYGIDPLTKKPLNTFWVDKSNLIFLEKLHNNPATLAAVPIPARADIPLVILTFPWEVYSVGTPFVRIPEQDTKKTYAAYAINPHTLTPFVVHIPKQDAYVEQPISKSTARKMLVLTLNSLLDRLEQLHNKSVVPYTWGGSSCTLSFSTDMDFYSENGKWIRPYAGPALTGYDCAELILRVAQIYGFQHPYKTSHTVANQGKVVQPTDTLENGDIIWVPGHVILISNIAKNEIIQARGYASGYGKLYRTKLKNYFKNIHTFNQLRVAYEKQQPVTILNKDGSIERTVQEFKLIKLV